MVFRSWRLLALCACLAGGLSLAFASAGAGPPAAAATVPAKVTQLRIDGEIEPILANYIAHGIEQANLEHADLILISINTRGGLDESMRSIIHAILTSQAPVVTYVAPTGSRAAS